MRVILARVQVRDKKRTEFLKIMTETAKKTQNLYGCEQFEIYQHLGDDLTFSLCGLWKSSNEFKAYLKSDEFSMVLLAFKLLRKSPEIRYFKNQINTGLEGLLQLRRLMTD
ncbi:MAG: putative quinol monooxygenase [Flavobacteriaceae bacterium]